MKKISEKEINGLLIEDCKKHAPDLWNNIEAGLQFQPKLIYSESSQSERLVRHRRLIVLPVISSMFIICILLSLYFVNNNFFKKNNNIAGNTNLHNQAQNMQAQPGTDKISSSFGIPVLTMFYHWQNKYYFSQEPYNIQGLQEDKNSKLEIGKYLGKSDDASSRSVYEIKNVDPSKSIAIEILGYIKADFAFNDTIIWNGKEYFIDANHLFSKDANPKLDYIGEVDSFKIYYIQGVDANKEIALQGTHSWYYPAVRK